MKTAVREFKEWFKNNYSELDRDYPNITNRLDEVTIEKEKKQIIEAHEKGLSSMGFKTADFKQGTKYYDQKFKS